LATPQNLVCWLYQKWFLEQGLNLFRIC